MGDRVLIQFINGHDAREFSPVAYLHWHGDSAPALIRACADLMRGRDGDTGYAFARFIGICHNAIGGNLSLGAWNTKGVLQPDDSHGDAGCYVVNVHTWQVQAFGGYGEPFNARDGGVV
jgi:hypothetical protein